MGGHFHVDESIQPWQVRVEDLPKLSRAGRWTIELDYFKQHVRYQLRSLRGAMRRLWGGMACCPLKPATRTVPFNIDHGSVTCKD